MEFETILSLAGTLIMLIALQAVLGFDNLLYIALESKKAPKTYLNTKQELHYH